MPKETSSEELADHAIEVLRSSIETEKQIVTEEHELHEKLMSWEYIFNHLEKLCPEDSDLYKLNGEILDKIVEIRDFIETETLQDLRIEKEEEDLLEKLEEDVRHRAWRAVKRDIRREKAEEKKAIRLHRDELRAIHIKFLELLILIRKKVRPALKDLTTENKKEDFEKREEYYFLQIYKFISAYERIFRHLLKKERILLEKLKRL